MRQRHDDRDHRAAAARTRTRTDARPTSRHGAQPCGRTGMARCDNPPDPASCKYSSPILYQYFASKEALVSELRRIGFEEPPTGCNAQGRRLRRSGWRPSRRPLGLRVLSAGLYRAMNGLAGSRSAAPEHRPRRARVQVFRDALETIAADRGARLNDPDGAVNTLWALPAWLRVSDHGGSALIEAPGTCPTPLTRLPRAAIRSTAHFRPS